MSTYPEPNSAPQGPPHWFFPALIAGMLIIAGLVAALLTLRPPAAQAPAAQPTAAALVPTAAPAAAAPAEAHGGLNPDGPPVERISLEEARRLFDAGAAVFVDVRAGDDYGAGHIPGALTITSRDLEAQLSALPPDVVIIAYGDATRPESGARGAQIFMELGYPKMIALEGGFQAWRDAGHPTIAEQQG